MRKRKTKWSDDDQLKAKKKVFIAGVIVLALCIVSIFLITQSENIAGFSLQFDPNAVEGGWEDETDQEITQDLNNKVADGTMVLSLNKTPVFQTGTEQGYLMIVNDCSNNYPEVAEIYCNEDLIYRSDAIPVGSKIEYDTLDIDLDAGTYDCTEYVHILNPDTGEIIGTSGVNITITILS